MKSIGHAARNKLRFPVNCANGPPPHYRRTFPPFSNCASIPLQQRRLLGPPAIPMASCVHTGSGRTQGSVSSPHIAAPSISEQCPTKIGPGFLVDRIGPDPVSPTRISSSKPREGVSAYFLDVVTRKKRQRQCRYRSRCFTVSSICRYSVRV